MAAGTAYSLSPPQRPPTVAPWLHTWGKARGGWEEGKIKARGESVFARLCGGERRTHVSRSSVTVPQTITTGSCPVLLYKPYNDLFVLWLLKFKAYPETLLYEGCAWSVRVIVILKRTVMFLTCDRCFGNLSGSHHQSELLSTVCQLHRDVVS